MIETWQPQTARNMLQRFEMDIFPVTSDCSRVFNFAIDSGLATMNPALRLANVLLPKEGGHFPAIDSDSVNNGMFRR